MKNSLKNHSAEQRKAKVATPQTKRTPGRKDEVKNNHGGFVFKVSDLDRLNRFLILGTDGATYYVGSDKQVKDATSFLTKMIKSNEAAVRQAIVEVSDGGRAYSNSPALYAYAMLMTYGADKAANRAVMTKVVRTGTHLFEFTGYLKGMGGMGRSKRGALADWYTTKSSEQVAYQTVKYRQREGFTHRDVLRIAHPKGLNRSVGNFILGREHEAGVVDLNIIEGFNRMQKAGSVKEVVAILGEYKNLPWETIPTQFLKDEKVWKTLFYNGQLKGQALVRNITRLAKMDAFKDMAFAADYADRLTDEKMIEQSRLHPINYLNAAVVYSDGQTDRRGDSWYGYSRNKSWTTNGKIKDALDAGFHASFKYVEPAGKRTLVAVDVSGSMSSPAMGLDLSCAQVSGAVAMTVARTERASEIRGFTSGRSGSYSFRRGGSELTDLDITARTSLSVAMRNVQKNNFGGTDCALPMTWALENKVEIDTFVVITDNETWAGAVKPAQSLRQYRDRMGIDARLAVLGVSGSKFTIADPSDSGMMDFVGFDSAAPKVLADFSAGRI